MTSFLQARAGVDLANRAMRETPHWSEPIGKGRPDFVRPSDQDGWFTTRWVCSQCDYTVNRAKNFSFTFKSFPAACSHLRSIHQYVVPNPTSNGGRACGRIDVQADVCNETGWIVSAI